MSALVFTAGAARPAAAARPQARQSLGSAFLAGGRGAFSGRVAHLEGASGARLRAPGTRVVTTAAAKSEPWGDRSARGTRLGRPAAHRMPPGALARLRALSHIPAAAARRGCPRLARGNAPCEPWVKRRSVAHHGLTTRRARQPPPPAAHTRPTPAPLPPARSHGLHQARAPRRQGQPRAAGRPRPRRQGRQHHGLLQAVQRGDAGWCSGVGALARFDGVYSFIYLF
jgi:hypothetical protein